MDRLLVKNILLSIIALSVCVIAAEAAIRQVGEYDVDGQFYLRSRAIRPYRLPIKSTQEVLTEYLNSSSSFLLYDPTLGWTIRPSGTSTGKLYVSNSVGLRSSSVDDQVLATSPHSLRVAIFGDSFTFGDEVSFDDTWGHSLQILLHESGIDAEVLNFGVPGYGIDQAYLRWQNMGRGYSPDIVVLGFSAENVKRNVNIVRQFYIRRTRVPFSKPRFVLRGETLELINVPTIDLKQLPTVIEDFDSYEHRSYEHFYVNEDYADNVWLKSKLVASILEFASQNIFTSRGEEREFYSIGEEPATLAISIIRQFKAEVESSGATFIVLHLPWIEDLKGLRRSESLPYADLLRELATFSRVIHPETDMVTDEGNLSVDAFYSQELHFSPAGNRVVAGTIAESIIGLIEAGELGRK